MKGTTDIWLASFLMLQGHSVDNFDVIDKHKGKYYFNLTDEEWETVKMEFHNSDISKVKMYHVSLKDLLY
jgi:hypothetical protein